MLITMLMGHMTINNNGGEYNRGQRVNYRGRGQNFRSLRGYPGRRYYYLPIYDSYICILMK